MFRNCYLKRVERQERTAARPRQKRCLAHKERVYSSQLVVSTDT
ncbi:hypothetical protein Z043_121004 [Scleropages formosus]|uniref:Uncharacterized protein n=1 Tax=Scleropages formosus TaxID=113540 RepID=A0A0P7Y5N9_SCLFO|nr:hypothetical protein Z043_121004 [Scleropages formosus]